MREGVPFRDAHEQVAAEVRAGTFEPPEAAPRLGDVGAAVRGEEAVVVKTPPLPVSLAGRDFLRIGDLVPAEVEAILDLAVALKVDRAPRLPGKTLGLFFAQPSTRTRISFAVAIAQLGGTSVTLLLDDALARASRSRTPRTSSRATSTRSRSVRSPTTSSRPGPRRPRCR